MSIFSGGSANGLASQRMASQILTGIESIAAQHAVPPSPHARMLRPERGAVEGMARHGNGNVRRAQQRDETPTAVHHPSNSGGRRMPTQIPPVPGCAAAVIIVVPVPGGVTLPSTLPCPPGRVKDACISHEMLGIP